MGLQATVNLNAPDLPNTGVWFANAAAFKNYMATIEGTVDIASADNAKYVPQAYDDLLPVAALTIDGVDYLLVTSDMFNSLKAKLDALDTSYQNMRTELKATGLLTEAQ